VVIGGVDVPCVGDVRRQRLICPPRTTEQEALNRGEPGRLDEEFINTGLAVGQPVTEKGKIARKTSIPRSRKMNIGIEGVVDRHTFASSYAAVLIGYAPTAAIREHEIIMRER